MKIAINLISTQTKLQIIVLRIGFIAKSCLDNIVEIERGQGSGVRSQESGVRIIQIVSEIVFENMF